MAGIIRVFLQHECRCLTLSFMIIAISLSTMSLLQYAQAEWE